MLGGSGAMGGRGHDGRPSASGAARGAKGGAGIAVPHRANPPCNTRVSRSRNIKAHDCPRPLDRSGLDKPPLRRNADGAVLSRAMLPLRATLFVFPMPTKERAERRRLDLWKGKKA
ncbi:hypothetical protein SUS17_162 [Sphingomonas sp. S17]|nr:hypothetical protein SUS17_162 [Sphingomonas sp. S17]